MPAGGWGWGWSRCRRSRQSERRAHRRARLALLLQAGARVVPQREAAVERGERYVAGGRELARAALEQHLVAGQQGALRGLRRGVVLDAQLEHVRVELVQPRGAERGEQLEARRAAEPGQREPLEHTCEAPLRRPVRLAREPCGLGAVARRPLAVRGDRALVPSQL